MFLGFETASDTQDAIRAGARALRRAHGLTQAELAARSGVSLGSLKRFERTGEIALAALLRLAETLDSLGPFHALFPLPEPATLTQLEANARASAGVNAPAPSRARR